MISEAARGDGKKEVLETAAPSSLVKDSFTLQPTNAPTSEPTNLLTVPTNLPTSTPTSLPTNNPRFISFRQILYPISGNALDDGTSYQFRAFEWLVFDDGMQLPVPETTEEVARLTERYILAAFYFATTRGNSTDDGNGQVWVDGLNFLSSDTVCDWGVDLFVSRFNYGVICNGDDVPVELHLGTGEFFCLKCNFRNPLRLLLFFCLFFCLCVIIFLLTCYMRHGTCRWEWPYRYPPRRTWIFDIVDIFRP